MQPIKVEDMLQTTNILNNGNENYSSRADVPGLNLGIILSNQSSSIQKRQRLKV